MGSSAHRPLVQKMDQVRKCESSSAQLIGQSKVGFHPMDSLMIWTKIDQNMKTTSPQTIETATPVIGVDEARRLLDLAIQNEALLAKGEVPDAAQHRALNELTGSSMLLPSKKP